MSGRLTVDNLSEGLKKYLEGLGLTEEQVSVIIQEKIGDLSTLLTTDKSDIVKAVNEVKTKVDKGQNHKLTGDNGRSIFIDQGADLNDYRDNGEYNICKLNIKNAPTEIIESEWFFLKVYSHCHTNDYCYQKITTMTRTNDKQLEFERICHGGTWQPWRSL